MRTKFRIVLLLFFFFCKDIKICKAQEDSTILREVNSLIKSNNDTVITISESKFYFINDTLSFTLLLHLRKGNLEAIGITKLFDAPDYRIEKLNLTNFNLDSNIQKVKGILPKLDYKQFKPYIFKDSINGFETYNEMGILHVPRYDLNIYSKDFFQGYYITETEISETVFNLNDTPINLNFRYNISLPLFIFFSNVRDIYKRFSN